MRGGKLAYPSVTQQLIVFEMQLVVLRVAVCRYTVGFSLNSFCLERIEPRFRS